MSGDKTFEDHAVGVDSFSIMSRYEVSESAYNFAKKFLKKSRIYSDLCDKVTDIEVKKGHLLNEMQMSMSCFIYCQICLEAYINSFASDKLPELWEKLDKLKIKDKWLVFPKIALGKTFDAEKEPYNKLQWLTDQRNFIVHHKAKYRQLEMNAKLGAKTDKIFNEFTAKTAEKAFELVQDLIKGLHCLDNSKIPDWLV
jgi:hypothetical protein